MYSLIKNLTYSRWLFASAAALLVGAGVHHVAVVHDLRTDHLNRPLQRSLNMLLASIAPAGSGKATAPTDSRALHLDGCSAADLGTLDKRLADLDTALATTTGPRGAVATGHSNTDAPFEFDRDRLEAQVGQRPPEVDGGDALRCTSLIHAADWLLRRGASGLRLALTTWHPSSDDPSAANQATRDVSVAALGEGNYRTRDPWSALPGCILMADAKGYSALPPTHDAASTLLCRSAFADGSVRMAERSLIPLGMENMRHALAAVAPEQQFTGNAVDVLGNPVQQGPHYVTTFDPGVQAVAQQTANCYTGEQSACQFLGIDMGRWQSRYEKAAVRMAGVLVMDIASGAIEAAGSSHTRCFEQEFDGPARDPDCVRLPTEPRARPYELENHALYTSYMPGSLVKPILAMGMLKDLKLAARLHGVERNQFQYEIRRSNSVAFLNRLFCKDTKFQNCLRPGYAIDAANSLGWNAHCGDGSEMRCARIGALSGGADEPMNFFIGTFGLSHDDAGKSSRRMSAEFDAVKAQECAAQPGPSAWRRCKGGHLVDLESEAWGQGNALASPVGVGTMLGRLGTAANDSRGHFEVAWPHLFKGILAQREGALQTTAVEAARETVQLSPKDAQLVLSGMAQSHFPAQGPLEAGTAYSACLQVYGGAATCAGLRHIAGKTGTPPFGHDLLSINDRLRVCGAIREQMSTASAASLPRLKARWTDCKHRPIKWYAALLKNPQEPDGPWRKVVVVIVERNWGTNGFIDSPGDIGPNAAAELGFQVIKRIAPQAPSVAAVPTRARSGGGPNKK